MKNSVAFFGYGFSREGREAAWKELEANLPEPGPDCPPTLEMLDLALGLPLEAARVSQLQQHLGSCPRCLARFESQKRAVRKMNALPLHPQSLSPHALPLSQRGRGEQEGGPTLAGVALALAERRGRQRSGKLVFVGNKTASGAYEECKARVEFDSPDHQDRPLRGWMLWTRACQPGDRMEVAPLEAPGRINKWHVALRFPGNRADPQGNDPELLEGYADCAIDLQLSGVDLAPTWALQIRLYRLSDGFDLGSHPLAVDVLDPHQVTEVCLFPGRK
jgi:hypothetical protein